MHLPLSLLRLPESCAATASPRPCAFRPAAATLCSPACARARSRSGTCANRPTCTARTRFVRANNSTRFAKTNLSVIPSSTHATQAQNSHLLCLCASYSRLDSRRLAFCRAPADVFDRSPQSDRRQPLLSRAVRAPAQVALGVVSGVVSSQFVYIATKCTRSCFVSTTGIFSIACLELCPFDCGMQDSSDNSASAKTSFQIASMDAAGNVVVWTVVEKQVWWY